jgi:hypothetical protein
MFFKDNSYCCLLWPKNIRFHDLSVYIYKNVTARLCVCEFVHKRYTKTLKSPNVVHRWRCNLDTTLEANTRVLGYNFYIYIDVKTCFYAFTAPRWRWLSTERKHLMPWQRHRGRGGYLNVNVSEWLCVWSHVKDVRVFGESVLKLGCMSCGIELCRLIFVV